MIKHYPLTALCVALIWYLSFFTPPHTQLDNVAFIDKWVHIIMYGGTCGVFWVEYFRRRPDHRSMGNRLQLLLCAWLAPIVMSGVIELLQEYCTNHRRSGDWLDLAANATGVTLAALLAFIWARKPKA